LACALSTLGVLLG
jgi:hypothetical protein